ncbi:MAG: class I SAM-dependent methyltransferase [Deltaproteobacteria bacterium]|nr:class I SAM-dependent methyltransferase [Deltaproteobacteria bacterium]
MSRLRLYLDMVRYGNVHNEDFAREHWAFFRELLERLRLQHVAVAGLRALDVGCGKSFWLSLLLQGRGALVTGVDTEVVLPGLGVGKYLGLARSNGLERAARTLAWELLYARPYYRALERASGAPLPSDRVDLRNASVTELPFADATFDLAVSHEVFEHLPDVPGALAELRRVLKPAATACIYVHNFASLSGGHHIAWKYPDSEPSTLVPPWDHLRENRFPEIPSWVNRLRERDYRAAFERHFEISEWLPLGREGEALLTPRLREELAEYTDDELLTKGFLVLARPRPKEGTA